MSWMYDLWDTMNCGTTYAHGSWGYTGNLIAVQSPILQADVTSIAHYIF